MPNLRCELHHRICNLRYGTHGYEMDAYEGMAKIIDDVKVAVCPECGNIPSLTVEKQKNGCKASKINACSRFLFRNDMCYCAIFFTLW